MEHSSVVLAVPYLLVLVGCLARLSQGSDDTVEANHAEATSGRRGLRVVAINPAGGRTRCARTPLATCQTGPTKPMVKEPHLVDDSQAEWELRGAAQQVGTG